MDLFFPTPDWQNSERYDAVSEFDRAGLAWEFVRRDPQYRDIVAVDDAAHSIVPTGATIVPDEPPPLDTWGLSFR
jgi:hypothetical protein